MGQRLSSLGRSSTPWWVRALLITLLLLSFALRLYDLEGKSLWSDEGLTLRRAEQPPGLILENVNLIPTDPDYQDGSESESVVRTPDLHPPLYFLLMHVWMRLAGKSEFALRFPSVVAASLSVPLLYVLARSLFNREAGLWAAVLGSISPFYLWYAQEARMYTWLVVLSLASVYLFLPLLEDNARRRDYAGFAAITLTLLYTHYAGFLLLAFEVAVYVLYRLRRGGREAWAVLAALGVAVLPLVPFLWRVLQVDPFSFTYRPLTTILREAWGSFSLGPTPAAVQPWGRVAPFLILFAVGGLMVGVPRRRRAWVVGLGYLVLPILIQYGISFFKPSYMNPRHLMIVAPAWELVMGQGLATLQRKFSPGLLLMLSVVLLLRGQASFDILTSHRFWKDDIRGAVQYIEDRARPEDAIVLHHPVIRLTFDYYYDGPCPETAIPRYGNNDDKEQAKATFRAWAERHDRIWFVYGPPPTYFPHDFLPDWADSHLFKVQEQNFEAWWTYVGVSAYQSDMPTVETLPPGVEPLNETWEALRLAGFRAQDGTAGENGWLDLYWQAEGAAPEEPLNLRVQLRDEAGTVWHERTARVLPFYTPAAWPADQTVHVEFRLPLPKDLPPMRYSVAVEPIGFGDLRPIGPIRINRPASREPAPAPKAGFGDGIELQAVELGSDTFRAGYPLTGALTWRASKAPQEDYRLRARLIDSRGREVAAIQKMPSAAGFPTSDWLPADKVAGRLVMSLPADLESGVYRVEISLIGAEDGEPLPVRRWYGNRAWLTLGTVRVEAWPMVTEVPEHADHQVGDAEIAESVWLRAYDLARHDHDLQLTLYWEALDTMDQNYHVFVHVGTPGQPPLVAAGGLPMDWTRPTTSWREGEVIADTHTITMSDVPPGEYDLMVGFYDPATGQRPRTVVDGDVIPGGYVLLKEVEVE